MKRESNERFDEIFRYSRIFSAKVEEEEEIMVAAFATIRENITSWRDRAVDGGGTRAESKRR